VYANIVAIFMTSGKFLMTVRRRRAICRCITGHHELCLFATSAENGLESKGPFPAMHQIADSMLRVIRTYRPAAQAKLLVMRA